MRHALADSCEIEDIEPFEGSETGPSGPSVHETLTLYCLDNGHPYIATMRCTDRTCQTCRTKDAHRLLRGYSECIQHHIDRSKRLRFMTLTIPNINTDDIDEIKGAIKRVLKDFRRLRSKKAYKNIITAGIRGVEVKFHPGGIGEKKIYLPDGTKKTVEFDITGGWNVHLHLIYQGEYLKVCCKGMKQANTPKEIHDFEQTKCARCTEKVCLRRDWKYISKGAPVVDIRRIWSFRKGLEYMLKYMLKPPDIADKADIYNAVLKGTRIMQTFGDWFKVKIKKHAFACPICGCTDWYSEWELEVLHRHAFDRGPP